jgi:RHS repeat-associated protein
MWGGFQRDWQVISGKKYWSDGTPVAGQQFEYAFDADGNLVQDGLWIYTWDAENRLVSMQSVSTVPAAAKRKLDFVYDHQGRRTQKVVSTWNGSAYVPQSTNRFVYDGWNLAVTLASDLSPLASFTWGLDLSGSPQGAGGVGGLLWMTIPSGPNAGTYFYAYDGNGKVVALVNAADGSVAARYEYGPFGELLRATGPTARANPFRFSTKYQDEETGLFYYGYRYYDPSGGRWPSRDPIEEDGGHNLYGFVGNSPVNLVDVLGLAASTPNSTIGPYELGWEWLTGDGPKQRDFVAGDWMTEELRKHGHVKDSIDKTKTSIFFRCQSCNNGSYTTNYPYSLAGWQGVLKYLYDYSTWVTGGMTGNQAVSFLGSYKLEITASGVRCSQGTATLSFYVYNESTAASGTRPPWLGYTKWYQTVVAPNINKWFQSGGMSTRIQTFRWTEDVTFQENHCCFD